MGDPLIVASRNPHVEVTFELVNGIHLALSGCPHVRTVVRRLGALPVVDHPQTTSIYWPRRHWRHAPLRKYRWRRLRHSEFGSRTLGLLTSAIHAALDATRHRNPPAHHGLGALPDRKSTRRAQGLLPRYQPSVPSTRQSQLRDHLCPGALHR